MLVSSLFSSPLSIFLAHRDHLIRKRKAVCDYAWPTPRALRILTSLPEMRRPFTQMWSTLCREARIGLHVSNEAGEPRQEECFARGKCLPVVQVCVTYSVDLLLEAPLPLCLLMPRSPLAHHPLSRLTSPPIAYIVFVQPSQPKWRRSLVLIREQRNGGVGKSASAAQILFSRSLSSLN